MRRALLFVLTALLLAGCGAATPTAAGNPAPAPAAAAPAGLSRSLPTAIDVPAIDAQSSLVSLGLNADKTVEVPPVDQPLQAGFGTSTGRRPARSARRSSWATSTATTRRASSGGCTR